MNPTCAVHRWSDETPVCDKGLGNDMSFFDPLDFERRAVIIVAFFVPGIPRKPHGGSWRYDSAWAATTALQPIPLAVDSANNHGHFWPIHLRDKCHC